MKKNLIVGQSGGPTAVINCSLYGVVSEGERQENVDKVYGMVNGIEGFLKGNYLDFAAMDSKEKLLYTPGAFLGSCRYKLPEDFADPVYPEIFKKLEEMNIGYFCYIGGNDSMDTVSKLSRYASSVKSDIRFIGVPKTVDNDLVMTDHTPGFGSAARYVAQTVREITRDASVYDKEAVTIVEIMGRHAGWLTAAGMLARQQGDRNPYLIYLPEVAFDVERFIRQIQEAMKECKALVVCVSEGIRDQDGTFICEYDSEAAVDNFGHKMLTGCGKYLERLVQNRLGVKVRSVELNVSQRCSAALMSKADQKEAVEAGMFGVKAAVSGETGKMAAFSRKGSAPYEMECTLQDVNLICNQEKTVPKEWIIRDGSDVSQDFMEYALPLIQGRIDLPEDEFGLADFVRR
ncbi:MAG: 6-phosphofructokinase [Hespellia sp.]|nr:6-phosphofructokinase [Hespellia sp.]